MHAHLEYGIQELKLRRSQGTAAFFSCGTLREWEQVEKNVEKFHESVGKVDCFCGKEESDCREVVEKDIYRSFGIHPWHCSGYADLCSDVLVEKTGPLWEAYTKCDAVGEIGMDSVWCDILLELQKEVFCVQLQIAEVLGKPVILHTKGQEREIAGLIRDFKGKICVHWYSGDVETLQQYQQKDCHFTLGPDLARVLRGQAAGAADQASAELYRYMLDHIPAERLFLETDGVSAVAWARGAEELPLDEIPAVLKDNLRCLAERKGMTEAEMNRKMWENLGEFLRKG